MKFDNKLFDNLILHACGITIVDYNSVEKVDTNSCRFSFFHHYPVCGGILINYVERYLVQDMDAIKKRYIFILEIMVENVICVRHFCLRVNKKLKEIVKHMFYDFFFLFYCLKVRFYYISDK